MSSKSSSSKVAAAKITGANSKGSQVSSKPVQKKISQVKRPDSVYTSFYRALSDPFHPNSLGCQVPDPFPFPTQTFHVHQTTILGASSGTVGGAVFMPNPVFSMIDLLNANNLATHPTAVTSTPMTVYSGINTNMAGCLYGAITSTSLNTVYSSYRVVSWGIKISNLQPELSATGRLMLAMVPIGDSVPSQARNPFRPSWKTLCVSAAPSC
jgi:hypothetical protein